MSKRKFGLKSLFSTRNNIETKPHSPSQLAEGAEQWPSEDSEGEDHFDPNDVNRPPPLDARTEAQLRHACRVIVDNLKPSGHDIEDTRMMNDMYVDGASDDEAPSATYIPGQKQAIASVGPSTWFEESSDRNSSVPHAYELQAAADKRGSGTTLAERESYHANRRSEQQRLSRILKVQNEEDSTVLSQVESPIAPAASVRRLSTIDHVTSPIPHVPDLPRAILGPRNVSSSTTSTQPTASTNDVPSASTSASSAYPTPASTSKRTSGYTKRDMQDQQSNAVAAGAWMKEEVDRRRQAEPSTIEQQTDSASPTTDDSQEVLQPDHSALAASVTVESPTSDASVNNAVKGDVINGDPASRPEVHSRRESATSRRRSSTGPSFTVDGKCSERTRSPESLRKTPTHDRAISATSEKPHTAESVVPPPAPPVQVESVSATAPAVDKLISPQTAAFDKTMAEIRARMAVTGLSSHLIAGSGLPFVAPVNPHDVPPLRSYKPPTLLESSLLDTKSTAVPNGVSSFTGVVPRLPPVPNKHQLDSSVIVKDFGRPASARALRNQPVSKITAQTDIDAVGFDSFMNVVEKTNTKNAPPSPTSSSHYGSPTLSAAATRPGTGLPDTSSWSLDQIDSIRPLSGRSHYAATADASAPTGTADNETPTLPAAESLEQPPSSHDQQPPPKTAASASLNRPFSQSSRDRSTSTDSNPKITSSRNMSAFDFLKDTPVPPGHNSSEKDDKKNDFIRVEPHSTYNIANGTTPQTNGNAGITNGISPPTNAATTNGTTYQPHPPKSARTFSLTSRATEDNNNYAQTNGYAPGFQYQTLSYNSTNSKGLKNWLSRRRSRSLIPGAQGVHQKTGRGAGFSSYAEVDEEDDPLVCAAPVVAFGRGY